MYDDFYYVSIIVTSETNLISSELLRLERPLDIREAHTYDEAIAEWLKLVPVPGKLPELVAPPEPGVDNATLHAAKLPHILERGRDPELFGPYFQDPETEMSVVERRPYDQNRG